MTKEQVIRIVGKNYTEHDYDVFERFSNNDTSLINEPNIKGYVLKNKKAFGKLAVAMVKETNLELARVLKNKMKHEG